MIEWVELLCHWYERRHISMRTTSRQWMNIMRIRKNPWRSIQSEVKIIRFSLRISEIQRISLSRMPGKLLQLKNSDPMRHTHIFQNARTEIIPILAITAIASGQSLEDRKKILGVLSIKEYVQKKGTPVLPLARGVRRKVRIWLASSVPKNLEYDLLALVKKYINE